MCESDSFISDRRFHLEVSTPLLKMPIDCLIVGYNDGQLESEVNTLRAMGISHPNYRDLNLNMIQYEGKPYRAMDIFNRFYNEGRPPALQTAGADRVWHHADVLWMVIMYLGTYLSRRGFTFDYINLFQLQKEELREKLLKNEYLTVAITTTIYNFDAPIIEVVQFIRELSPKTKIIVGGPYIAKRSETMEMADLKVMFKYIGADFYVRSREGEQALVNILRALKNSHDFVTIPNIAFRDHGDFQATHSEPEVNALYENLIDYSLFPREHIGSYVNVRITKGCPFTCSFCSFPLRTEKYNVSKLQYIQQELDAIREVGTVTGLFFTDDTVNVPLGTFKDMMRMMIARNYGFKWHCFFRADFCDEELADLMAKAGCQGVFLGLESANDQLLANMNKTPRKHHYLNVVPLFKNVGIQVFASLFFGFPGETYETATETMEFLEITKPDFYRPLIWYCDPVTPIWAEKQKYGIKGYHFSWSHNTMDVGTACHLVERCFTTFDVPIWVPDPGFNFVSLFLLQNRGMSFPQIKTFLKCFNTVVREKLSDPGRSEPSPRLIENLKKACQFDHPRALDQEAVEIFSVEEYKNDERFWLNELCDERPLQREKTNPKALMAEDWHFLQDCEVKNIIAQPLSHTCAVERSTVLITAYYAALRLVRNRSERTLVVGIDEKEVFPVRLQASPTSTFRQLAQLIQSKIDAAKKHRLFAFRSILNIVQMPANVVSHPVFDGAYLEACGVFELDQRFRFPAAIYGALDHVLLADSEHGDWRFRFMYSASSHSRSAADDLGLALATVLKGAVSNPDIRLDEIELRGLGNPNASAAGMQEGAPQFAF